MNTAIRVPHAAAPVRLLCIFLTCLLTPLLRAQTPIHAYEFNASMADTYGGPAMTSGGGSLGGMSYSFGAGQGPGVLGAVPANADYSLEMVFTLTSYPEYACLVNANALTTDAGTACRISRPAAARRRAR